MIPRPHNNKLTKKRGRGEEGEGKEKRKGEGRDGARNSLKYKSDAKTKLQVFEDAFCSIGIVRLRCYFCFRRGSGLCCIWATLIA